MSIDQQLLEQGVERHRAGDFARAREIYLHLLTANPTAAAVHNLLGALDIDSGNPEQAAAHLLTAVRLAPDHVPALENLGLLAASRQQWDQAADYFRRALASEPHSVPSLANLARVLARADRWSEAADVARRVAELLPADWRVRFELATALVHAGKRPDAIAAYEATLRLDPNLSEACVNLAKLNFEEQHFAEAERWSRRAIELRPDFAEAHHNLGCALISLGRYDEAIESLRTALRLKPELPQATNNLGAALIHAGKFAEAIEVHRHTLSQRPDDAEPLYQLGLVHMALGEFNRAIEHFDRAIAVDSDHGKSHYQRASCLLLQGRFLEGYAAYEWRYRSPGQAPAVWPWKLWQGERLAGQTLVLCCEGGRGDLFQFIRYAALLKAQGARVWVIYPAVCHTIMARTPCVDRWYAAGEELPDAPDYYLPLMSLPHRLRTTLETVPVEVPYVFADPTLIETWRQALAGMDGLKVGIVWQGSPQYAADRWRSIPLVHYAPLAGVSGVRLISLQQGPGQEQMTAVAASWPLVDLGHEVDTSAGAFMDTAAIMKNLDLVITSDTSAAHLAGALGVRVWVALPKLPESRWLLDREDSPWYPTMRLFRQGIAGDWLAVFARMAGELERLTKNS